MDESGGKGPKHTRYRLNVVGPYYVEDGCCTSCGVPHAIAPDLFSEVVEDHCYVRRQPETDAETDSMLRVIATQELGCIRYGGSDAEILRRLVEGGEGDQCDLPAPRGVVPIRRDHVTFAVQPRAMPWTAREILDRLVTFNSRWRATSFHEAGDSSASVSVAWFADNYHRIEAFRSREGDTWVIRHHGPPRLADSIHEWLVHEPGFESIRWQTAKQWRSKGSSTATPW
jgi:hypothetical protein